MAQWPGEHIMVSPNSPEVWTNQALRVTTNTVTSNATRVIVCFEVLDYDSLTYIKIGDNYVNVVALIYKKVTIAHEQIREYLLEKEDPNEPNTKFNSVPTMPAWYLDNTQATDGYTYEGTRDVEYILCIVAGEEKYYFPLGNVSISVSGSHNLAGINKDLIEDAGLLESTGPSFSVSGDRLYGVSVNCGKEVVTYSYDVEERNDRPVSQQALLQIDSPVNIEDKNEFWQKKHRIIGAINYSGEGTSKEFSCDDFPDEVMAINYGNVKRTMEVA
jgi:hypothetical protein